MTDVFGFIRVRRSLKEKLSKLLACVLQQHANFDFSYYLAKNAPLPSRWNERKHELRELASHQAVRAAAFREIFEECNSTNDEVSNFLLEYVRQVFPRNFLHGCARN